MSRQPARPATRAMMKALCHRMGLDPAQVAKISLLPDAVVIDFIQVRDGRLWEWTERRPVP